MKKTFVLDTNVLVHDPEAILHFQDNDIVIPITVIEELDGLKKGNGEIPYSARHSLRLIDSFRETGKMRDKISGSDSLILLHSNFKHNPYQGGRYR